MLIPPRCFTCGEILADKWDIYIQTVNERKNKNTETFKENFVTNIYNEYKKDTNKIYTYCYNTIEGFQGYMIKKSIIKPILNFKKPESCFRIDDNFIQASIKKLNIEVIPVSYNGDTLWTCSFDMNKSNTHPEWSELRSDHRPPMIQKCVNDFNKFELWKK